ncbi:hypothetical protein C8R44DRAFT_752313 [Mycena epipterygia]|nr:hypothetical protein C8R44DRAFT_752313 [Mycena epipterygia]
MPPKTTLSETRTENIVACLTPVIPLLTEFSDAFGTPFIPAIVNTTLSLITLVQNVKKNKEECIQLMENIHELLYAVVNLHIKSETPSSLPPTTLSAIGELMETLHKVHAFMEAQQDGNKIKHFFRQRLKQTVDVFKMEGAINIYGNMVEMQKETERIHKELLEVISTSSDATISDKSSSIYNWANSSHNSSNSISMLPAKPKILHGRESELKDIVKTLKQDPARIAILGAGGMGKTSLAKAALHHPDIISKYQHRFFVAADSTTTSIELAALIGLHIGLKPGKDLTKPVVHYFSNNGPSLLITVRGAERPAKVRWTRPFLQPLKPLSDDAARQTFVDIAEDFHDSKDITKILSLTDNMPLVVDLIAHLVDLEGCENVLARWGTEKTSLLSSGHDRRSNLDISIQISLSSPRLSSGAKDLLSLLSILPDGLSNAELLQSKLSIKNLLECRSMLLRTSLAYEDDKKRLKSLVPIREHMQQFHPAPPHLVHQVEKHFHFLLDVYENHRGSRQIAGPLNQITVNLGNIHQVLLRGLQQDNLNLGDTINCVISLNHLIRMTRLEVLFIIEVFRCLPFQPIDNPEQLIAQAIHHFANFNDPLLELGEYLSFIQGQISKAKQFLDKALVLAKSCGNQKQQAAVLSATGMILLHAGDYPAAQVHAQHTQRLAQPSGDLSTESSALWIEAICTRELGDYKSCMTLLSRAKRLRKLCGISQDSVDHTIMASEAQIHFLKSEYAQARGIYTEHLFNVQNKYLYPSSLLNLAEIDIVIGASPHDVHQNLDKARETYITTGNLRALRYCDISLGQLHLRERETHTAKLIFQQYINSDFKNNSELALACLESLANTSQWPVFDFEWASRWTVVYLVYANGKQNKRALHKALQFLGDVFLTHGDLTTSHSLFTVALETFTYMDIHRSRAECMLRLGDIARHRGDLVQAQDLWKEACPLFEQSSQAKDMTQIDTRLALVGQEVSDTHQKSLAFLSALETPNELPSSSDAEHLALQNQEKTLL